MTEAEWLSCTDPQEMLGALRNKAGDRKLRLFAIACCLHGSPLGAGEFRPVLQMAEAYADGLLSPEELWRAYTLLPDVPGRRVAVPRAFTLWEARAVSDWVAPAPPHPDDTSDDPTEEPPADSEAMEQRRKVQCGLLRDIAGNPFRPVTLHPAWRGHEVRLLAQAAYEERNLHDWTLDPMRLAVLGDALEEVGCTNQDVLNHCRAPGQHVRGCWLVDLLRPDSR
jgi:hypothetical protein